MQITLEAARPGDIPALAALWNSGWHEAHAAIVPQALTRLRTPDSFATRTARHLPATRVARDAGRRLGFSMIRGNELYQLYAAPGARGGRHFGSRVVEARDGTLFISLGERGDRPSAQDLGLHQGSVVRINRDGTVPASNPFTGKHGAQPEIWSYGHRNPQGMSLDLRGNLWVAEHGAKGGDEVNRIRKGANYGWPVISYGRHYSGRKIGEGTSKPGMEQPEWYWDPSIAPSGMMIYSGRMWPEWRGDIFVGSLKFDYISRLSGSPLKEAEQLRSQETGRIRDVQEAPDGSIWFASESEGAVFRISR